MKCRNSNITDVGNPDEQILRAVEVKPRRNNGVYWNPDGSLNPFALEEAKGLSVERTCHCDVTVRVEEMQQRLCGHIVAFKYADCQKVKAILVPRTEFNPCHYELHGSKSEKVLDPRQRRYLAHVAQCLDDSNAYHEHSLD